MNDLVIRGATVVDGLGNDPRRADVAVKDGRIAAIGEIRDSAARTIDGGGLGHWSLSGYESDFSITSTMWSALTMTEPNGVTTYLKCLARRV